MKQRISLKKVVALLFAILLPVLTIALGVLMLICDMIFNTAFAITYVILPLVFIGLIVLVVFKVKRTALKWILTILLLGVYVVAFLFSSAFGTYEFLFYEKNADVEEEYAELCKGYSMLPTLEEVGAYTEVEYYDYFSSTLGFFSWDAYTLIVHYDSAEYQKQKAFLETKYVFQKEEMKEFEYSCQPFAEINGYTFRVLDISGEYGNQINYPKSLVFIATNEQSQSISYTAFSDADLDYIVSLEEFLLSDCGWKYIIK